MKGIIKTFFAISLVVAPLAASAGVAVIANPAISTGTLTGEQVSQIFMGRLKTLPDGATVIAVDQKEGTLARDAFLERVLGKNEQQMRAYWVRMVFTGKGQPPRNLDSDAEVIRTVMATPGAVGYVDSKSVTPTMKVLYRQD